MLEIGEDALCYDGWARQVDPRVVAPLLQSPEWGIIEPHIHSNHSLDAFSYVRPWGSETVDLSPAAVLRAQFKADYTYATITDHLHGEAFSEEGLERIAKELEEELLPFILPSREDTLHFKGLAPDVILLNATHQQQEFLSEIARASREEEGDETVYAYFSYAHTTGALTIFAHASRTPALSAGQARGETATYLIAPNRETLHRLGRMAKVIELDGHDTPGRIAYNVALARELQKPVVAAGDAHDLDIGRSFTLFRKQETFKDVVEEILAGRTYNVVRATGVRHSARSYRNSVVGMLAEQDPAAIEPFLDTFHFPRPLARVLRATYRASLPGQLLARGVVGGLSYALTPLYLAGMGLNTMRLNEQKEGGYERQRGPTELRPAA